MSIYNPDDYDSGWTASKIVGVLLTLLGAGVVLSTVVEIFQLFTHRSAFIVLDEIVPEQIEIVKKSRTLGVTVRYSEVDF